MENVTTDEAPADGVPPSPPIEDSGLHDIKALAKTTRQRVHRISSQHDALRQSEDALLSASSSGLHMVALPEPAKVVSLPSIAELAKAEPSIARAAERVAADATDRPRRSPAVWIAGAVVAAAAAAVGIIVVKGGSKDTAARHEAGAASAAAGSGSAVAASHAAAPAPAEAAVQKRVEVMAPVPPSTATAAGSGSASGTVTGAAAADLPAKEGEHDELAPQDAHHTKGGDKAKDGGRTLVEHVKKDTTAGAGAGATTTTTSKVKKNPNEPKSLDDLIDEAAGGPGGSGAKKPPAGDSGKPALDKKELTPQDIRSAMGAVAKRAQACYDKFNQAGTVGVKASVAPSGAITKVTITGAFAGTPTGDCVANVVQNVSFPAWDGAPMTVNYSYLLSE